MQGADYNFPAMNKAFTRETDDADDDDAPEGAPLLPQGTRNYMTPGGFARLKAELDHARRQGAAGARRHRSWAAGNGDRSENGDYIYGKKRLREIDRRIRFLVRRLDRRRGRRSGGAPRRRRRRPRLLRRHRRRRQCTRAKRARSASSASTRSTRARGYISWVSPMARALIKAREGDTVTLHTPAARKSSRSRPCATCRSTRVPAAPPRVDARGAATAICNAWTPISPCSSRSSRRSSRTRARCARRTSRCGAISRPPSSATAR